MEERYLTPEAIQRMLQKVEKYRRNTVFRPEHSALLIIDMQEYFSKSSSHAYIANTQIIIPGINKLIKAYSKKDLPIIVTRHLNSPQNAKLLAKWWADLIMEENPLSEITEELDISKGIIIKKSQYDAFYETDLEDILRKKDVTKVVICGVMTNLCCETTARSAFVRGFEVFFTIDGTATQNEEFHMATLLNLSYGFAIPVPVKEVLSAF
jgi:nicotinamidase-related amidase